MSTAVCYDPTSGAPIPCGGFTVYDSYSTDPRYQRYFTIAWTSALALAFLLTVPSIITSLRPGSFHLRSWTSSLGVSEAFDEAAYRPVQDESTINNVDDFVKHKQPRYTPLSYIGAIVSSFSRISFPIPSRLNLSRRSSSGSSRKSYFPFSTGKLVLVLLIPAFYLVTLLPESQLRENPNRFGFLALAGLPPLFVLSSKNGAASWLLGKSWTTVNFLHRWLARMVVLLVLLHFYFWTVQYQPSHTVTEFLSGSKERRGIGALSFLLLIGVTSAGPLRRFSYPIFFTLHYVGIIGFLTFVNLHTIYARTWATWSIGLIYFIDVLFRLCSMRLKMVEIEPFAESGMTRLRILNSERGWRGGQHLQIRLFFSSNTTRSIWSAFRVFEQHPFSIANASNGKSIIHSDFGNHPGIVLYIRSCGPSSWSDDLHKSAVDVKEMSALNPKHRGKKITALALIEGPYGGLDTYTRVEEESLLFIAGGSGMSFILGTLDEIIGERIRTDKEGKIEIVWIVHQREHIDWFERPLRRLLDSVPPHLSSSLFISLQVYITSSSSPIPANTSSSFRVIESKPSLPSLISSTVSSILAPCSHCYPICRCGELRKDGVCSNDEEECVGSLEVANGRELIIEETGIEILNKEGQKKSCCSGGGGSKKGVTEEIQEEKSGCGSCCSSSDEKGEKKGCCSSKRDVGNRVREVEGEVRVRTGGFKVFVCGPQSMISETRQAVALIPLAKQVRLGGVALHVETYGV